MDNGDWSTPEADENIQFILGFRECLLRSTKSSAEVDEEISELCEELGIPKKELVYGERSLESRRKVEHVAYEDLPKGKPCAPEVWADEALAELQSSQAKYIAKNFFKD